MKLYEIFRGDDMSPQEYEDDVTTDRKLSTSIAGSGRSGTFATVSPIESNPHEHMKRLNKQDSAYTAFAKLAIKHAATNPYFPRIRAYSNGSFYQIETLIPLDEVDKEEIEALNERIFTPKAMEFKISTPVEFLTRVVNATVRYGHFDYIQDEQLAECLRLIDYLAKSYNFKYDIHSENMMCRRTKYGLQLVIIDPLWLPREAF